MLVKDHNNIPHVTSPIIQFVSQSQINKKTIQQEQSESFDQSFPSSSLVLLNNLIIKNEVCKQISNTPNFLISLIKLTKFKFNNDTNKEEDKQSLKIRNESIECLRSIHRWGDEQVQVELVTNGYPRALVIDINTAGGNEYQQDKGIGQGLENIFEFIIKILKGREINPFFKCTALSPQPFLFKSCQEQFEDEGGNEEITAQLVNKCEGYYYNVKDDANRAKEKILHFYVDNSNPRPRWYNY
ncbi:MAG: hypothetical protein EZS28_047109 [Streblomastix strix]|uniref:Uncharacterized protein n=1 Tax=Streblomastix strix TaxID=222440 RepID=A0A5J4TG17_9EUKA|nr:MAG: hypothetical protein EZS28_047109 [Streblomastix strix]